MRTYLFNTELIKSATIMVALFCFLNVYGQNQAIADSLKFVLEEQELSDDEYLKILKDIAFNSMNPGEKIEFSKKVLQNGNIDDYPKTIISVYIILGSSYSSQGQVKKATEFLFEAADLAIKEDFKADLGAVYGQLASVYGINGDTKNSFIYKKKSLNLFEEINDLEYIGYGSLNLGYEYYKEGEYDSALHYTNRALPIFKEIGFDVGVAYAKGNTGLIKWKQGDFQTAENLLLDAIQSLRPLQDYYGMADYLHNLGRLYFEQKKYKAAISVSEEGLEMAEANDLKEQAKDASLLLSQIYERQADDNSALFHHKRYVALKDSIQSIESTQEMADLRTAFEVGQKQSEVDLLISEKRTQRIITISVGAFAFIFIVLASIIYKYYRSKAKINRILGEQKAELERLNSTKDKFFSIISHDLRSPVAGFHGISQMIKMMVESKQTDELLEMTEHIDSSVDQLSKLLDNLLNWAMQQQGHIPNVPEKLSLKEITDDLTGTLSNMASGKSIELIADIPSDMELWADKNMTMTILRNLVSNALKFTPDGGKVGINASKLNGKAKIEVYDTGVGMPDDKLKKLFQLQDKKSTYGTSGEKGLGLGLQLVHEFMEIINGTIEVASKENEGTTFTLYLPLFDSVDKSVVNS